MKLIFKLAKDNLKRNKEIYLPYAISLILSVIFFFVIINLTFNKNLDMEFKYTPIRKLLYFTSGAIAVISLIFNLYSNRFLSSRRSKDYGIYNILGLEKKHIKKIVLFENLLLNSISIVVGIIAALILDRLNFIILAKFFNFEQTLKSIISLEAVIITIGVFILITIISYFLTNFSVMRKRGLELIKPRKNFKRHFAVNIVFSILGVIFILIGYILASQLKLEKFYKEEVTIDPLNYSLIAVIFVIVGTYFLFQGLIILIINLLKKNNKFYKRSNNFIAISNLSFRLKENALGLATICILSCMILVTTSMSLITYEGIKSIGVDFPYDIMLLVDGGREITEVKEKFEEVVKESNLEVESSLEYETLEGVGQYNLEDISFLKDNDIPYVVALTIEGYNELFEDEKRIENDEVIILSNSLYKGSNFKDNILEEMNLFKEKYKVKEIVDIRNSKYEEEFLDHYILVINNNVFSNLKDEYFDKKTEEGYIDEEGEMVYVSKINDSVKNLTFNLKGDKLKIKEFIQKYFTNASIFTDSLDLGEGGIGWGISPLYSENDLGMLSFVIVGVYLIIIFFINFLLILYYKQVIEGYQDAEQFKKLRKIGLSDYEIRNTVNKQVTIFFFLPLMVAIVHFIFAKEMIRTFSVILSMADDSKIQNLQLITILIFLIIYFIAYLITSRKYQSIILSRNNNGN